MWCSVHRSATQYQAKRHSTQTTTSVRNEGIEEALFVGGDLRLADNVAGLVKDTDGEEPGMQVDAAVELVLPVVESHGVTPEGPVGA
jgi:hypothetical protein